MAYSKEDAEGILSDIEDQLGDLLREGIEPSWLFDRYKTELEGVKKSVSLACMAMWYDKPSEDEDDQ